MVVSLRLPLWLSEMAYAQHRPDLISAQVGPLGGLGRNRRMGLREVAAVGLVALRPDSGDPRRRNGRRRIGFGVHVDREGLTVVPRVIAAEVAGLPFGADHAFGCVQHASGRGHVHDRDIAAGTIELPPAPRAAGRGVRAARLASGTRPASGTKSGKRGGRGD